MCAKRLYRVILFSAIYWSLPLAGWQVNACSCISPSSLSSLFKDSAGVFVGTVVSGSVILQREGFETRERRRRSSQQITLPSFSDSMKARRLEIEVKESWKGPEVHKVVTVFTSRTDGECGYPFELGKTYLVYAYQHEGDYVVSLCSRTRSLEKAYFDLKYLRGLSGAQLGGYIFGQVENHEALEIAKVELEFAQGGTLTTTISPDGSFEFTGLSQGKYRVKIELPRNLDPDPYALEIELAGEQDAVQVPGLPSHPGGRIQGRILDVDQKPASGLWVGNWKTRTDDNGYYVMKHIRPGSFQMEVEVREGVPENQRSYYFPGVWDKEKAEVFQIEKGQVLEIPDLVLPLKLLPCKIEGFLHLPDGRVAPDVDVHVRDTSRPSIRTDENGHFYLDLSSHQRYQLVFCRAVDSEVESGVYTGTSLLEEGFCPTSPLRIRLERKASCWE